MCSLELSGLGLECNTGQSFFCCVEHIVAITHKRSLGFPRDKIMSRKRSCTL